MCYENLEADNRAHTDIKASGGRWWQAYVRLQAYTIRFLPDDNSRGLCRRAFFFSCYKPPRHAGQPDIVPLFRIHHSIHT